MVIPLLQTQGVVTREGHSYYKEAVLLQFHQQRAAAALLKVSGRRPLNPFQGKDSFGEGVLSFYRMSPKDQSQVCQAWWQAGTFPC